MWQDDGKQNALPQVSQDPERLSLSRRGSNAQQHRQHVQRQRPASAPLFSRAVAAEGHSQLSSAPHQQRRPAQTPQQRQQRIRNTSWSSTQIAFMPLSWEASTELAMPRLAEPKNPGHLTFEQLLEECQQLQPSQQCSLIVRLYQGLEPMQQRKLATAFRNPLDLEEHAGNIKELRSKKQQPMKRKDAALRPSPKASSAKPVRPESPASLSQATAPNVSLIDIRANRCGKEEAVHRNASVRSASPKGGMHGRRVEHIAAVRNQVAGMSKASRRSAARHHLSEFLGNMSLSDLDKLSQSEKLDMLRNVDVQWLLVQASAVFELEVLLGKKTGVEMQAARDLFTAMKTGNMEALNSLLSNANVSQDMFLQCDEDGNVPLHYAKTLHGMNALSEKEPHARSIRNWKGQLPIDTWIERNPSDKFAFSSLVRLEVSAVDLLHLDESGVSSAMRLTGEALKAFEMQVSSWTELQGVLESNTVENLLPILEELLPRGAWKGLLAFHCFGEPRVWRDGVHTARSEERLKSVWVILDQCFELLESQRAEVLPMLRGLLEATKGPRCPPLDPRSPYRKELCNATHIAQLKTKGHLTALYECLSGPSSQWLKTLPDFGAEDMAEDPIFVNAGQWPQPPFPQVRFRCSPPGWITKPDLSLIEEDLRRVEESSGADTRNLVAELLHLAQEDEERFADHAEEDLMIARWYAAWLRGACQLQLEASNVSMRQLLHPHGQSGETFCARSDAKSLARICEKIPWLLDKLLAEMPAAGSTMKVSSDKIRELTRMAGAFVTDILGCTVIVDSVDALREVYTHLECLNTNDKATLRSCKNGFLAQSASPAGYRDVKLHIELESKMLVEVQLLLREFHEVEGFTHIPAELSQGSFDWPELADLLQVSLYDAVHALRDCTPEKLEKLGKPEKLEKLEKLREARFDVRQLERAGLDATQLRGAGFDVQQLTRIGFDLPHLMHAGFSAKELRQAGFDGQLKDAGSAKLKEASSDAKQFKESGFQFKQLKEAGFDAAHLGKAHSNATQLKESGFSVRDVAAADCNAMQLVRAGFGVRQLAEAGFSVKQMREAGINARQLRASGLDAAQVREAGFSARDLIEAEFGARQLAEAGFDVKQLQEAGLDVHQLKEAGFSAMELNKVGFNLKQLREAGFDATEVRGLGFDIGQLKDAGFGARQLKSAGFDAGQLIKAGFNLIELKADGFHALELKEIGFDALRLKETGFDVHQLKEADFDIRQLKGAGFGTLQMKEAGFNAGQLKEAGWKVEQLKEAGFDARQLKEVGFDGFRLKEAGFSVQELSTAYSRNLEQLKEFGFGASQLREAGFRARELKLAGFGAKQLKDAGFDARELREAGFGTGQLRDAGFDLRRLSVAGCGAHQLREVGFDARDLNGVGFDVQKLREAGYDIRQLRDAGFGAESLRKAGIGVHELIAVGCDLKQLRDAGFDAGSLKEAGFDASQLKDVGFDHGQLTDAGFDAFELVLIGSI